MIQHRSFDQLPGVDLGWLKARHHFPLYSPDDPWRKGWGRVRAWNDDEIAPGTGFALHSHANMEIITFVRAGAITHRDSLGNEGRIEAGHIQVLSAGTGIRHSEYNLENAATRIFQIWITPDSASGPPAWASQPHPVNERAGSFVVIASGLESDLEALPIRARARVLTARLSAGDSVEHALGKSQMAYLVPSSGVVDVNGTRIHARDGVAIDDVDIVSLTAIEDADVVMVDVR